MICPICLSVMKDGHIRADGVDIAFITEKHNRFLRTVLINADAGEFHIKSELTGAAQIGASYCKKCRKLIIDNVGPAE